jgi:hypothetical protein
MDVDCAVRFWIGNQAQYVEVGHNTPRHLGRVQVRKSELTHFDETRTEWFRASFGWGSYQNSLSVTLHSPGWRRGAYMLNHFTGCFTQTKTLKPIIKTFFVKHTLSLAAQLYAKI